MQINPDELKGIICNITDEDVSIVSIHADQSRRELLNEWYKKWVVFQSYQFMQINPDCITNTR